MLNSRLELIIQRINRLHTESHCRLITVFTFTTFNLQITSDCSIRRVQNDVTELNLRGLVFDEMTNGQAVMHYTRHRPTTSMAYVTTLIYTSTNQQWARLACPFVSSSKTKPFQFSSVTSFYTRLLRGRPNRPHCGSYPSVCLFVSYGILARKQKRRKNHNWCKHF